MRGNALGHASSRYSVVGLLAMSAPKSGTEILQETSVRRSASGFEPRTARIGADRFQLLCTVCDLPRATTGPLAAMKSPDATNMWFRLGRTRADRLCYALAHLTKCPGSARSTPKKLPTSSNRSPAGTFLKLNNFVLSWFRTGTKV